VRTVRADQVYPAGTARWNGPSQSDWPISVGVGDRYGLNFRYKSGDVPLTVRLSIIAERDGAIVCEDEVTFPPTHGHWQISRNRTCDDINAGTYFIRLESQGLDGLEFETLQVE